MIELKHLHKEYDKVLFDDLNISIPSGKITCILGESGVGKTTILKMIAGLVPYEGTITNVNKTSYIFQEDRLIPNLTVYENLKIVCPLVEDNRIDELLSEFKILDKKNKYPKTLSGGEAKRVAMVRAFLYDGELILMDEPFSSLDLSLKLDLINYFASYWKTYNKTVILVTHNVDEALLLANKILILKNGSIKAEYYIESSLPRKFSDESGLRSKIIETLIND